MIKLLDVLGINKDNMADYKVHFAVGAKDPLEPYKKFLIGGFKDWQEEQKNKNFTKKYILSLIYYAKDTWMFAGVYQVLPGEPKPIQIDDWLGFKYKTRLVLNQKDLIGRAFIHYEKEFRQSYPNLNLLPTNGKPLSDMAIDYIVTKTSNIDDFPGLETLNIDYDVLKTVINENISSWKTALSNVKGVYLVTDTLTGKHYVGSVYGEDSIWQKWAEFVKNGHGGKEELKKLLQQKGSKYKSNFKYSILEVCNMNLGNEYIIKREAHWKDVLMSRKFGLNKN